MNDQLCTSCGSPMPDDGPCQVCGLVAELASARAEAQELRDELASIRGDMADWYEFGPPTDSTRRKATLLREELSKCHAELDATRIDRDAVMRDYQGRLAEAFTDTGSVVMELEAAREALKAASSRLPDTCLLCGRKPDSAFVIDALFKVAYGLCLTCSVKPDSHIRAFDAMISQMRAATIMSLSIK